VSGTFQDASRNLQDASRTAGFAPFSRKTAIFHRNQGCCTEQLIRVGRVTPCAPPVANQRVRRAEDCPPYHFCPIVCQLQIQTKTQFPSPNRQLYPFRSRSTVKINEN
jgi:hypothetical protein